MYRETPPPPHLTEYIEAFWTSTSTTPVENAAIHPDGCMDIIAPSGGELMLIGAMPTTQYLTFLEPHSMDGIRFHPGMLASFLKINAAEWTATSGRIQPVKLDCSRELTPTQRALAHLRKQHGNSNLDWLASQANLSTRQFRRQTLTLTGLSPKHLARILRFRWARQLRLENPMRSWAEIAIQAGYCDQSHFIRDHKEFTGQAPVMLSETSNTASQTKP